MHNTTFFKKKAIFSVFLFLLLILSDKSFSQTNILPFGVSLCGAEFGTETLPGLYNKNYIYPPMKFRLVNYFSWMQ